MASWIGVGSRIADANRNWQAAEDTPVTGWDKANEFIIAIAIQTDAHLGDTDSFRVEYQDKTDVSGFIALPAAASELIQGTATVLVNGDTVASAEKGCNALNGFEEEAGELEGDNETPSITLAQNGWCEVQCAVNPAGAQDGHEYEFRLNIVGDAKYYTALATLTIQSGVRRIFITTS